MTIEVTIQEQTVEVYVASKSELLASMSAASSADAAEAAQAAAEEAQALAEAAALTSPQVYATKAEGLAAVGEGETFWSNEDGGVKLYRDVSGVATLLDEIATTDMLAATGGAGLIGTGSGDTVEDRLKEPLSGGLDSANADGTTDDKAVIDAVNIADAEVNLGGKTYAYTGSFTPIARFSGGTIISSVDGTFDYTKPIIYQSKTVTVGASGDIKTLKKALDYLKGLEIRGSLTLSLLEKNTPNNSTGSMALENYTFDHPDAQRILIQGSRSGNVPRNTDFVNDKATDLSFCLGRYSASIYLVGTDSVSDGPGLMMPNGIKQFQDVLIESHCRYSLDFDFSGGHAKARTGSPGGSFRNCVVFGGAWGVIASGCEIRLVETNTFAHQFSRGAFDLTHGATLYVDSGDTDIYTETVTSGTKHADQCLYGINVEDGTVKFPTGKLKIEGTIVNGIKARGASNVIAKGITTVGVTQPITMQDNSAADIGTFSFSDSDKDLVSLVSDRGQIGIGGLSQTGVLLFAGAGSTIVHDGGTISGCKAEKYLHLSGGRMLGWDEITIDDSEVTVRVGYVDSSTGNILNINITNSRNAGRDEIQAYRGGRAYIRASSGLAFSPAMGVITTGTGFTNTAQ